MIGDAPIDQIALRRDGFVEFPYELGNFSAQVFKTPSGKIELHSSTLANPRTRSLAGLRRAAL